MPNDSDVPGLLAIAAGKHLGAHMSVENVVPLTGGAASTTFRFDLVGADATQQCILRCAQPKSGFWVGVDKTTEAEVQQACFDAGIPVAEVIFVLNADDGLGQGYVMTCLRGETIPQKILRKETYRDVRGRLAAQCGNLLAAIHAVEPVHGLARLSVADQLGALEQEYRRHDRSIPAFELALRWLYLNKVERGECSLVHGDFRNGNLLVTPEEGLHGVLDWELCHVGDPMEDLGWLCVNSWRFGNPELPVGGFGDRTALFAAYEAASGRAVDPARVRFWELFGTLKWGVICLYMSAGDEGQRMSLEHAAIGRRVSETEADLLAMLAELDT